VAECKLDHSLEDVRKKLTEQASHLDSSLVQALESFLSIHTEQPTLNEIFHLLKKYDLSTAEERLERELALRKLIVS